MLVIILIVVKIIKLSLLSQVVKTFNMCRNHEKRLNPYSELSRLLTMKQMSRGRINYLSCNILHKK